MNPFKIVVVIAFFGMIVYLGKTIDQLNQPGWAAEYETNFDRGQDWKSCVIEPANTISKNQNGEPETVDVKLYSGGPAKDGIPSIDNPDFVSVSAADKWLRDDDRVLALIHKGEKRVYPLKIIVWHEIVNDTIGGDPVVVTYCPLCATGIAFERIIESEPVEFGTTGKLYNSNLVMYDRKTNTYWSQLDGLAIGGKLAGNKLTRVHIDTVEWGEWKKEHPDSDVLSINTGFGRNYDRDPYGDYYQNRQIMFPVDHTDNEIHPKTLIYGINFDDAQQAYKEDDLIAYGSLADTINETRIKISRDKVGVVTATNLETSEEIPLTRAFWFVWYAFYPDTDRFEIANKI